MDNNVPRRIRFDDAIWSTSDPKVSGKEVQKFTKNVNWCIATNVVLSPVILCQDIEAFPDGIEWIRQKTLEGIVYPDLHGWDHGPYGNRTQTEIEEHLEKSFTWFMKNLGTPPVRWVTPHGADSVNIQAAARKWKMVVETTDYPVVDQKRVDSTLRQTRDLSVLKDIVIMNHWWEKGLRLYRIAKIIEHQNIEAAILASKEELDPKSFRICWGEWIV